MKKKVPVFGDKQVRSVWGEEKEEWYFSVVAHDSIDSVSQG